MIGDRLDTDILFGKTGGLATLLVLTGSFSPYVCLSECHLSTGVTQESEITGPDASPIVPDFVTSSLGDLRAALQ